MAFKRTLAQRLFNLSRITSPLSPYSCRISSSPATVKALASQNPSRIVSDPGDDGIFRRFLHGKAVYQAPLIPPELRSLPTGEKLMEKLRGMNYLKDRISLDGLKTPDMVTSDMVTEEEGKVTVEDAKKLLRLSQMEMVKAKLTQIEKNCVSHEDFVTLCKDACFSDDQGVEIAKLLDESGAVIVLGNVVFIKPQQIMKVIQCLMPQPMTNLNDSKFKELEEMEKQKTIIDKKAEFQARRELWCGLGGFVILTTGSMRLTFWELTWDVMEPICYYIASIYFLGSCGFFLRTLKEPTFESLFQSRFNTKQKRLIKLHNFDMDKYNELKKCCYPAYPSLPLKNDHVSFA